MPSPTFLMRGFATISSNIDYAFAKPSASDLMNKVGVIDNAFANVSARGL
jgi:hypothetical protein